MDELKEAFKKKRSSTQQKEINKIKAPHSTVFLPPPPPSKKIHSLTRKKGDISLIVSCIKESKD
jgi:hypothetical protein